VLSLTVVVGANQATTQTPTQSPVQSGSQGAGAPGARTQEPASTSTAPAAAPLTLTGCIERGANGEFMLSTASAGSTAQQERREILPRVSADQSRRAERASPGARASADRHDVSAQRAGLREVRWTACGDRRHRAARIEQHGQRNKQRRQRDRIG
jgi:hypothetical protein